MEKIKEMMNSLGYEELVNIKKDLDINQGNLIKDIIKQRINDIESNDNSICVVCGRALNPHVTDHYTLVFGPSDLRKKANFCALDCLQYFLSQIKHAKIIRE
ncbi:MAG: hypothetical protein PHV16_00405 [Candidatus Nanoarchaeia archaeon]|nr:hypothetical protein [Candidatus Nanoarchaeia archaeon]